MGSLVRAQQGEPQNFGAATLVAAFFLFRRMFYCKSEASDTELAAKPEASDTAFSAKPEAGDTELASYFSFLSERIPAKRIRSEEETQRSELAFGKAGSGRYGACVDDKGL
jgi:hypothetical protein